MLRALVGFLLSLTPLTNDLMNWRGAQLGNGSASIGAYFFFGGVLMIVGAVGEVSNKLELLLLELLADTAQFIVGNTFPMVVFGSFGAFWATFGATLQPFYGAYGNYAPYDTVEATPMTPTGGTGLNAPEFNNAFGFFLLWMGVLCFVYMICALRTNLVFVLIFFTLIPAFGLLCGGFFYLGLGNTTRASTLIIAGGAFAFVTCILGWWIFAAILLASLDFPFQLPGMSTTLLYLHELLLITCPVFDLSTVIRGASDKTA